MVDINQYNMIYVNMKYKIDFNQWKFIFIKIIKYIMVGIWLKQS